MNVKDIPRAPEWRWWHYTILYAAAIVISAILSFLGFHFTVKLTIWYAKLRGWL